MIALHSWCLPSYTKQCGHMLCPAYLHKPNKCIKSIQSFTEIRKLNAYAKRALLPDVNVTNHNTLTRDQLDIVSPSGGGGLIGIGGMGIWGGIWGAPGAPGGRGGTAIPPGGGGIDSFGGRDPLMRGGGRFTLAAGGGPLDGTRGFSILKWNCRKNCEDKQNIGARSNWCFPKKNPYWICASMFIINLFSFPVPVGPEAVFCFINFSARDLREQGGWRQHAARYKYYQAPKRRTAIAHLKGNSLIWFSSHEQVLPPTIWGLNALFICRHETMPGSNSFSNLWVVNLMKWAKGSY